MDRADSRSTRSRSRSMRPTTSSNGDAGAAAGHANGYAQHGHGNGNGKSAAGEDVAASAVSPFAAPSASAVRKQPAAVAVAPANGHQVTMTNIESGNGRKNASPRQGDQEFFWCEGEPDVRKIATHLDTLTAAEQQLRATSVSLAENYTALNSTVGALLDSNQRLRKELRAQKLSANRRFFWGVLALLAATLGQAFVRSALVAVLWAMERPADAWPALLDGVAGMSSALWLLACPLVLALFVHHLLHAYSHGRLSLQRTVASMVLGLAMQMPLLYFVFRYGAALLADVQVNPLFAAPIANQSLTVAVWLAIAALDYTLIVLHYWIE